MEPGSIGRAVWCPVSVCLLKFCLPSPEGSASQEAEGIFRRVCSQDERDLEPRLMTSNTLNFSLGPSCSGFRKIKQLLVRLVPFGVISVL